MGERETVGVHESPVQKKFPVTLERMIPERSAMPFVRRSCVGFYCGKNYAVTKFCAKR